METVSRNQALFGAASPEEEQVQRPAIAPTPAVDNWNLGNPGTFDLGSDSEGCLFALGIGVVVLLIALVVKGIRKLRHATTAEQQLTWGVVVIGSLLMLGGLIFLMVKAA